LDTLEKDFCRIKKIFGHNADLTPADFKSELERDLWFGVFRLSLCSAKRLFSPHNRDRRISGLYFVGAGTHPAPVSSAW